MNVSGINTGVIALSPYQQLPTLICGRGRSGTSALMAAIIGGGLPCVQTPNSIIHEDSSFTQMWKNGDHKEIGLWRDKVVEEYSSTFFIKVPTGESNTTEPGRAEAWSGNYLAITRDITAVAIRESSVNQIGRDARWYLEKGINHQRGSMDSLLALSENWGVAIVSYEKLLVSPRQTLLAVAGWIGADDFAITRAEQAIIPNNPEYIEAQKRGIDGFNITEPHEDTEVE